MQYRRNYVAGGTYFFTVNLQDRSKATLINYIDCLRDSVRQIKQSHPFRIDAWVILPDHMHAMWTLPHNDSNYSYRWREIKKHFAKSLPENEFRSSVNHRRGERGIWQRRFWEHTIRDERDYRHHFDYIHINPLKHSLVKRVRDWPYSSFHRAVKQGIYDIQWGGENQLTDFTQVYGERK